MKPTLYMETSVPSYYTSLPSRDIIILAHQKITKEWWRKDLHNYNTFISKLVIDEASKGDLKAAKKRLNIIKNFKRLKVTADVENLGMMYLKEVSILENAMRDALHMAIASINGIDYLVTWNCKHIARGEVKKMIHYINEREGLISPVICTPEELLGGL